MFAYEARVPFQAVVSIGAFEHFARPQMSRAQKIDIYRIFFERIAAMTTPGARFSLQTIVWNNVDFDKSKELIPQTVFPQSDIPFIEEIVAASHGTFRLAYLENDPDEYADTLTEWIANLRAVKDEVDQPVGRGEVHLLRALSPPLALRLQARLQLAGAADPRPPLRPFGRRRQATPMAMPAASTSAPPTTTCSVARQNGVSMNRFWIQAIAQSSTNTTAMAMPVAVQKCGIR